MKDEVYMRLLILFDLPTYTKEQQKRYTKFRSFLISEGFFMMQYSVYSRCCRGMDIVNRELDRIRTMLPAEGQIRAIVLTEKQYCNMEILVGTKKKQESLGAKQLCLF